MGSPAKQNAKVERLELRASRRQASVIKQAAEASGKTVTAFILDAAHVEAQRELADRRIFSLDKDKWGQFVKALDRPAKSKPRLQRLLKERSVLD